MRATGTFSGVCGDRRGKQRRLEGRDRRRQAGGRGGRGKTLAVSRDSGSWWLAFGEEAADKASRRACTARAGSGIGDGGRRSRVLVVYGVVVFPASASAGRLVQDSISGQLVPQDSFRSAIKLANEMKVAVVVMDPQGVWKPEWGDLYRDTEAG